MGMKMSWKNRVAKEWLWLIGTLFFGFVIVGSGFTAVYTAINSLDRDSEFVTTDSGEKVRLLDVSNLPVKNPNAKKSDDPPMIEIFGINGLLGLFVCLPLMYLGRFTIWSVRQVRMIDD